MKKLLTGIAAAALLATTAAQAQVGGNLAAPPAVNITLALTGAAPALSETTFTLTTGEYYRLILNTDGGAEVLFTAPTLMQNIWLNQIVVAGMEIKLWGGAAAVAGVEVGEGGAGEVQITFVPIRPGEYPFWIDEEAGIGGMFIVE